MITNHDAKILASWSVYRTVTMVRYLVVLHYTLLLAWIDEGNINKK